MRRFLFLFPIAALVAAAGIGVALADNVRNDISSHPGSDTFVAGGSTVIGFKVTATSSDDSQDGCNASDGTATLVGIHVDPAVITSSGSLTFITCNSTKLVTFFSLVPGDYPITLSAEDSGGGDFNTDVGAFMLHVLATADATPPVITVTATPPNAAGWNTGDVHVEWTIVDAESSVTELTGCDATDIVEDGTATLTCTATSSGGTSSAHSPCSAMPRLP